MRRYLHVIGGTPRPARSERWLEVFDPAIAKPYAEVASGDAADPVWVSVESSDGSAQVVMQSGLPGGFDQALAILCGEDNVVVEAEMGRGHGR